MAHSLQVLSMDIEHGLNRTGLYGSGAAVFTEFYELIEFWKSFTLS